MQDIKRPYNRSKSNRVLDARPLRKNNSGTQETLEENKLRDIEAIYRPKSRDIPLPQGPSFTSRLRRFVPNTFVLGTFVVLIAAVGAVTYVFDHVEVLVTPKMLTLPSVNKTIPVAKAVSGDEAVHYVLATSSLSKSKILSLTETKKVETKATGQISVYNNYSTDPQRLVKNTRFESSDGKIFRITDSVTIPGKKGDTPGSVTVTVAAESYGEGYNIPPADFTIPGFKNSPRYKGFFGRGIGTMTGGSSGEKKIVSPSLLATTKDELALTLSSDLKEKLGSLHKDGFVTASSVVKVLFTDNEAEILSGATTTYTVIATGYVLMLDEHGLAKSLQENQIAYNNEPLRIDHQDQLVFTVKDSTNIIENSSFDVLVTGNAHIERVIDEEQLRRSLVGQPISDFEKVISTFSSISKAEVDAFPTWLRHFPEDMTKIRITEKIPVAK